MQIPLKQLATSGASDGQVVKYSSASGKWVAGSVSGAGSALAAVTARRTTTLALTTSFADVSFDATDVETDISVIQHNDTTTARIDIKETATYLILYKAIVNNAGAAGATFDTRIFKNGATAIPGSEESQLHDEGSNTEIPVALGRSLVASLTANDYVTLQVKSTNIGDSPVISAGCLLSLIKLEGAVGATGPAGADGDITWAGSWATSTAYSTNQAVKHNGSSYVCISGHTSDASSEPGVGGSWATYWETMAAKGDQGAPGSFLEVVPIFTHNSHEKSNTSTTYTAMAQHAFRGSSEVGSPATIKGACRVSAGSGGACRIYDVTNAKVIVEKTGLSNTSMSVVDFGTISNVPSAAAVWEVQIKNNGLDITYLSSVSIKY